MASGSSWAGWLVLASVGVYALTRKASSPKPGRPAETPASSPNAETPGGVSSPPAETQTPPKTKALGAIRSSAAQNVVTLAPPEFPGLNMRGLPADLQAYILTVLRSRNPAAMNQLAVDLFRDYPGDLVAGFVAKYLQSRAKDLT